MDQWLGENGGNLLAPERSRNQKPMFFKPFSHPPVALLLRSVRRGEATAHMIKRITIIQGHPDAQARHFGHALADEYAKGAEDGGHETKRIEVARLDFPLLRTKEEFEKGPVPDSIRQAQDAVSWADHLVILYLLWLDTMRALGEQGK
jgi:hypothetical protein